MTKELETIAAHETKKWNCSFSIAFHNGEGDAVAAAGAMDPAGTTTTPENDYVWGSVTKVITGSSILRLAADGKIDLDGPMRPHVDAFLEKLAAQPSWNESWSSLGELWGETNASQTTVRQLLHMQSPVPDFDTATPCSSRDAHCVPTDSLRKTLYQTKEGFTPIELMSVPWVAHAWNGPCVARHEGMAAFCYSSTNFMLLGMILANELGVDRWQDMDQAHFLPPVLKDSLRFAKDGNPPDHFSPVHGIDRTSYNVPKGTHNDADDADVPGVFSGWTASDVVGTPAQIARLAWEVYAVHSVAPKAYVDMMVPSSGDDLRGLYEIYGLATHNLGSRTGQASTSPWGVAYGHLGATYGYQSIVAFFPKLNATIAVATSMETDDQQQPADALCLSYNKAVDVLLDVEHNCTFVAGDYYSGGCKCDPIPVKPN